VVVHFGEILRSGDDVARTSLRHRAEQSHVPKVLLINKYESILVINDAKRKLLVLLYKYIFYRQPYALKPHALSACVDARAVATDVYKSWSVAVSLTVSVCVCVFGHDCL